METEKTSMTEPPKFKFLDDNCSDCDLTEGKTHQRIADQLYDLIVTGPPDGMTIGLEGDWGSGKSTVIELLRQKLEANGKSKMSLRHLIRKCKKPRKTFFFYIDAWEHEGDPLRRVFLEALIDKLKKSQAISWKTKNKLEKIRKKVPVKKSATKLTGLGLALACAGLLMPVVAKQIPPISLQVPIRHVAKFCQGLNIWVVLLCVAAVLFVWQTLKIVFEKLGKPAVFSTERTTGISLENERTSIEFSRYFDEILDAIKPHFDKILMVIDNLDRIDPKDALRGWSTLQTFVQRKNPLGEQKKGIAKWIIVPYAEEGFGRIWNDKLEWCPNSNEIEKEREKKNDKEQRGEHEEKAGEKRLASYLDKNFDLRLHVPEMLVGDWRSFARECICNVRPKFSDAERAKILNVLVWMQNDLSEAPSPRQIKLYVNHVRLLRQLHGEGVSITAICFYVITRYLRANTTDSVIKTALLDGKISDRSLPTYFGPLTSELAAILFNVEREHGMQILLEPSMKSALKAADTESLRRIRGRFGVEVFDDVMGNILSHTPENYIVQFIVLIQKTFGGEAGNLCRHAFQCLKNHQDRILRSIQTMRHNEAMALLELAKEDRGLSRTIADAYVLDVVLRFAHSGQGNDGADTGAASPGKVLLRIISEVLAVTRLEIKIPYVELIGRQFAFSLLTREEMDQFLGYVTDLDEADTHLGTSLAETRQPWSMAVANWFAALTAHGMVCIEKIFQQLEEVFDRPNENIMQTDGKDAYLSMLVALESIPLPKRPVERIRKLLLKVGNRASPNETNSKLFFLLAKYQENDPSNTGALEARFTHVWTSYRSFMDRDDAEEGAKVYRYTALSEEREWLARMVARPQRRLGAQIVKAALEANDQYLFHVPEPYAFASNVYPLLKGEERTKLVGSFISDPDRVRVLSEPNGERLTVSAMMCRDLLAKCPDDALRGKLMDKCVSELRKKKPDEWRATFALGMPELLAWLDRNGVSLDLGTGFSEFFQQYLYENLSKERDDRSSFDELSLLYRSMNAEGRAQFAESVGSRLLNRYMKVPPGEKRRFLVEIPDYSGWLQKEQAEIGKQASGSVGSQRLEKLELLSEIMSHQRNRGSWWDAIRFPLAKPLEHLAEISNPSIKQMVQRIECHLELVDSADNSGQDTDDHAGDEELREQPGDKKNGSEG